MYTLDDAQREVDANWSEISKNLKAKEAAEREAKAYWKAYYKKTGQSAK